MKAYVDAMSPVHDKHLAFCIRIKTGPVIGGVIGQIKLVYDLRGNAANIASRMESQGVPGRIQVTQDTYELIKDEFVCKPRGSLDLKGRGELRTWFLVGTR